MRYNKLAMANELSRCTGLTKKEAAKIVDVFFEELVKGLVADSTAQLTNFGRFRLRQKAQRIGRNPKTMEDKMITARSTVLFYPSKYLRDMVALHDAQQD